MGTLMISHDDSLCQENPKNLTAAVLIVHCKMTGYYFDCQIVEILDSMSSYRGDILESILTQLVLRTVTGGTACENYVLKDYCDNKGVLYHGDDKDMTLKNN